MHGFPLIQYLQFWLDFDMFSVAMESNPIKEE